MIVILLLSLTPAVGLFAWVLTLLGRPKKIRESIYDVLADFSASAYSRLEAIPWVKVSGGPARSILSGRVASLQLRISSKGIHFANLWIFWDTTPGEPHIEIEAWDRSRHLTLAKPPYKLAEFSVALSQLEEHVRATVPLLVA
jgi:hypothetical protein